MSKFYITLIGLLFSIQINAQSFTKQVLNKERFDSGVSLMQDYDNDGDLDIIVSRSGPTGVYVLENEVTKQFPATPIITDNLSAIRDIDMGDIDNDGDIDYVISFNGLLAWFQRQNDGTYIKWTIGTNISYEIADIGDFDGDGWLDIVAVGDSAGRLYTNLGNFFFQEQIIATSGIKESLHVADVDNDGDLDIAFGGSGVVSDDSGARLLINDGNATFTIGTFLHCRGDAYNDCGSNENIEIVDLNGDGTQDILAFTIVGTGGLYWLDGSNNFDQIKIDDNSIDLGGDFVVFDIDNNGLKDIVRQATYRNYVSVLYQNAPMQFTKEYIDYNWKGGGSQMSVADLDNDGDLDLAFPGGGRDLSWFENINGQLFRHQVYAELDGVRIPKMVDWDNDGDLDIFAVVASTGIGDTEDELILYENIDGENFVNWRLHDYIDGAVDLEFADIDGDGDLDVFASASVADDVVWLRNDGFQANWIKETIWAEADGALGIASGDIDDDGDPDVIVCSYFDDKVFGYLNDGNGSFNIFVIDVNLDNPHELEIADLDNDGDKDIAVVCLSTTNSVVVYYNDGAENFTKQIIYTNELGRDIEIGDWNQDGTPDIFASFSSNAHVVGFIRDNGAYVAETFQLQNDDVLSLKLSDIDGDGDLDIISGHSGGSQPELYANIVNQGSIEYFIPLMDYGNIYGIDVGDINNDGILDIVLADYTGGDLVLLTIECLFAGLSCDDNNPFTFEDIYGNDCNCLGTTIVQNDCTDITLNITASPIADGIYDAVQTVSSTGVVANGSIVSHIAGNEVILNAGFTVESNGNFVADIVPCTVPFICPETDDTNDAQK